jgi:hypothetical protein
MFVATFEAVKTTSPLRHRVRDQLKSGAAKVEKGLRMGVRDGSVCSGIDIARAVSDISTACSASLSGGQRCPTKPSWDAS